MTKIMVASALVPVHRFEQMLIGATHNKLLLAVNFILINCSYDLLICGALDHVRVHTGTDCSVTKISR